MRSARCTWTPTAVRFGTGGADIDRLANRKISTLPIPGLVATAGTSSIFRDREQALWVSTGTALFRVKDGISRRYTTSDGLSSDFILRIHQDAEGSIWVATENGLD